VAESEEFTLDASVAQVGFSRAIRSTTARMGCGVGSRRGCRLGVGPAVGDEVGVSAQQGSERDEPQPAQQRGQQFAQRAEDCAGRLKVRVGPGVVLAQYGDLVTEHQDLKVLGCVGPGEQRQPAQCAGEREVRESKSHRERSFLSGRRGPVNAVCRGGAGQEPRLRSRHPQGLIGKDAARADPVVAGRGDRMILRDAVSWVRAS
jgi:hypothetical protein